MEEQQEPSKGLLFSNTPELSVTVSFHILVVSSLESPIVPHSLSIVHHLVRVPF